MVKEIQSSHTEYKLTVMNANDSGALQLVLFNKRVMTQHKSKWIALHRGKQGFVEVPELDFEIEMKIILRGMLSLST